MEVNVEIQFENGTRPRFSSASCVVIRVEDISRQDVSSKLLIEQLFPVAEVRPGAPIKFKVLSDKPDKDATDVSVSATLHFGHCTRRLRDGDYFTDTNYFLNISNPAKSVHDIKIFMLKFGKFFMFFCCCLPQITPGGSFG